MTNSDMIVFTFDNESVSAGDYWSEGRSSPSLDISYNDGSSDIVVLESEIVGS